MKKFYLSLCALLLSSSAFGSTFVANPDRTVYLRGPVADNALTIATNIEKLSRAGSQPIDMIINSPGGSIITGLQIISAMEVAKQRGITIRCFVPMLAASMGFQVFAHCSERYVLEQSLLLWHPARIFVLFGAFTSGELLYQGRELKKIEAPLARYLIRVMGVDTKFFNYHYRHETLWLARDLRKETDFFEIVDSFENVVGPYNLGQ